MTPVRIARATDGVSVVVPAESDVDGLVAALDRSGERYGVVVVDGPDALARRHPDRVRVVRGTDPLDAVDPDHRWVLLPGPHARFTAARLPALLAAAREERADVVVASPRRFLLRGNRDAQGGKLVDRAVLAKADLTGTSSAALLAVLRGRGARVVRHPVDVPEPDHTGSVADLLRVQAGLVRSGWLGRVVRRLHSPGDPVFAAVLLTALVLSVTACTAVAARQLTLAYPDAVSHLMITRRVFWSSTPGAAQLGGVWLPLPHVLSLPLVGDESWYRSGVAPSVVSMCAYIATAGWLYRIGTELTGRRMGGVTAAVVFGANPNVLYLQSTPMTEALLLACLAAATWHLVRWCRDGDYRQLAATAAAVLGATLVRYEGWVFLAAVALVVVMRSWQRARQGPEPWVRVRAEAVFFGCLAVSGIAGWMVWNAAIFGDPLTFVRGQFAKPALWVSEAEPAVGDWGVSLWTYLHAMHHDIGWLLLLAGAAGLVLFVRRTRLRAAALAPLPLLVFLPFFVYALHSGQRPLHVPEVTGDLYNVRFALVMVLPAAVFTAYLVTVPRKAAFLVPAVALLACVDLAVAGTATFEETYALRASETERFNAKAAAWLRGHYDHGTLLIRSWSSETVTFDARIPTDRVVYEGSFGRWEPALADPVGQGVRWIHLRTTPGREDEVWRRLHDDPGLHTRYELLYTDGHHQFHRLVEHRTASRTPAAGHRPA
ncbi:MAG: family 2 glycosyl transferase [Saccharothrix sp.]|nr:family 2 glycosyl transferase [Saccharothrix sp.]